eukprot:GSChrysophyteH1.ASY1.ANO1.703.1 assembled CDS
MPQIQQWIVRILLICPIYAISSAIALKIGPTDGIYVEFVRDLYEAFVVYSLLNLIMEYCGGEVDCVYSIEAEGPLSMPFPFNFCMKPKNRNAKLLRFCQRGVLQFVLVKPIMAATDVVMMATGNYYNKIFQIIETTIYNISYCTALYALLTIYLATRTMLKKFRCITKISAVKLVILTAYYQELAVKLAPLSDAQAFSWKCLLLSVEMVFFSSMLACAFPISEFMGGIPDRRVLSNIGDLFAVRDIVEGFEHNFKPVYKDYALQRSQSEAPETVRLKTYLAGNIDHVAMEMTERYRGRSARFAFNSLLRGNKPIRAGLRPRPAQHSDPSPYTQRRRRRLDGVDEEDDGNEDDDDDYDYDNDDDDDDDDDNSEKALVSRNDELEEGPSVLVYDHSGEFEISNPVQHRASQGDEADSNGDLERLRVITERRITPDIEARSSSDNLLEGNSFDNTFRKKVPLLAPPRPAVVPYETPAPATPKSNVVVEAARNPPQTPAADDSTDFGDFEDGLEYGDSNEENNSV